MKLVALGIVALALVFGTYTVVGAVTAEPPVDHVLVLDGSASFADEVATCPSQLKPTARDAAERFGRLRIASFAREALGRPWFYDVDYRDAYDDDHDRGEVEFATREEWFDKQADTTAAKLAEAAAVPVEFGSALLEQLERIARELDDSGERRVQITVCSDGEIIDEGVDVRKPFDQDAAVELWLPRLSPGLEGASVRVVGFGRGLSPDENRRAREFIVALLDRVGVSEIDLVPGAHVGDRAANDAGRLG